MRNQTFTVGVVLTLTAIACSARERTRDSTLPVAVADSIRSTDSTARADTACQEAGAWTACNLQKRLESAGLAPRGTQGSIRQPFFTVPGIVFAIGSGELQGYLYPDTAALARDLARIDTIRVAPPTMQVAWRQTPTLIRSNNLLAVLLSDDEIQVERVRNAITAGLPASSAAPAP